MSVAAAIHPSELVAPKAIRRMTLDSLADSLLSERLPLRDYIREAWKIIEPAKPLVEAYYVDLIAEYLTAVSEGQITRLAINIPPRKGKSNLVTVIWPTWDWTVRPSLRVIAASYSLRLATKHSVARRRIIESKWYRDRWGKVIVLQDDQNQKTEFENTARGIMAATSTGGTATGTGGDILIADDLMDPKRADSDLQREAAHDFFDKTLSTRLDDKTKGAIVVIEQRLHTDDITGHVLRDQPGLYTHLSLPAIAPEKTIIEFPISGKVRTREAGELLSPRQENAEQTERQKQVMGSRAFMAQYQQTPSTEEGDLFKRAWWKYWTVLPADLDEIILSWDMTFKDSDGSDYVVGQVWARKDARFFLLDQVRARMDFPTTQTSFRAQTFKWPKAYAKLVEEKANGAAIIASLKALVPGIVPIIPKESKLARAQAVAPLVEAGNVVLPDPSLAPWINDFVEELAAFPLGQHDDQVDATSQALAWLADRANRRPAAASVGGLGLDADASMSKKKADWM